MHRYLLAVALFFWDATDVTTLTVDSQHPTDSVAVAIPEIEPYAVTHLEAASLRPFCLAITSGDAKLWDGCFRAGFIKRDLSVKHQGGDGAAFTLTLTNPVPGPKLQTLVRLSVSRVSGDKP